MSSALALQKAVLYGLQSPKAGGAVQPHQSASPSASLLHDLQYTNMDKTQF